MIVVQAACQRPEFYGAAQTPKTLPWQPSGLVRSTEEALLLSEQRGIIFPEEVQLILHPDLPADVYAAYLLPVSLREDELWSWRRFLTRLEVLPIRLKPSVLMSDEAIIGVLAHEAFELNALHSLLPDGQAIPASRLYQLIAPGIDGNLHCRAWDDADEHVQKWRTERTC